MLDILFILIIVIFTAVGFWRGLIMMIGGLLVTLAAGYVSLFFGEAIADSIGLSIDAFGGQLRSGFFLVLFTVLLVPGHIALKLVNILTEVPLVGFVKHIGGGILGLIQGVIIIAFLSIVFTSYPLWNGQKELVSESKIVQVSLDIVGVALTFVPQDYKTAIDLIKNPPLGDIDVTI